MHIISWGHFIHALALGTLKDVNVVEFEVSVLDIEVYTVSLPCLINASCKSFEVGKLWTFLALGLI